MSERTTTAFDLLAEPWIEVMTAEGRVVAVSLREVFPRAQQITQVVGEVPTQSFAILRLLLAILHRACQGPANLDQWSHMWHHWDDVCAWVSGYLDRYATRFDLRHPAQPFFQVAGLRSVSGGVSGLEKLIADVPNGALFQTTRLGRGLERISWPEAARWLVHVHAFDPAGIRTGAVGDPRNIGGRGYPIGPGWAGQIGGVYVMGSSLAETLLLNLVVPRELDLDSSEADRPPWERQQLDQCVDPSNDGQPRGLVDLYTWQARRVRLVGDDDGVTGVLIAQGDRVTPQNRFRLEPLTGWRFSEPQTKRHGDTTYMPREHDPERAFWRGLNGLLAYVESGPSNAPHRYRQPAVLDWLAILRRAGLVTGTLRVRATAVQYGAKLSTFEELIDDVLVMPVDVLVDSHLARTALDAVEVAELAVQQLAGFARNVAAAAGASPDDDGPRERVRELAFARLDGPFRHWLADLSPEQDLRRASAQWQDVVRRIVFELSRQVVADAGVAAWIGRDVSGRHVDLGRAEVWFLAGLSRVLPLAEIERAQSYTTSREATA